MTLAQRWDGTRWHQQPTPNPTGAISMALSAVACTSSSACISVGSPPIDNTFILAERWNGTRWRIQPTPSPVGRAPTNSLAGIACTSAAACVAVGQFTDEIGTGLNLVERWDGTAWRLDSMPNPPVQQGTYLGSSLTGAGCASASACTAVGGYTNQSGTGVTLAERWDGTAWRIQPTPNPAGTQGAGLSAVSCPSPSDCIAVGSYETAGFTPATLAERWDGTSWHIQTTPTPTQFGGDLSAISCTSASACTAVGTAGPSALAERWDGTTWKIQPTPNMAGVSLYGVACPSRTACLAVGDDNDFAVADHWNGTTWLRQSVPRPAGARGSALNAVSCYSRTACSAVGYYNSGITGNAVTLAERWDGTTWGVQPTPNPAQAQFPILSGVARPSPSVAIAVGNSDSQLTLAEQGTTPAAAEAHRNPVADALELRPT